MFRPDPHTRWCGGDALLPCALRAATKPPFPLVARAEAGGRAPGARPSGGSKLSRLVHVSEPAPLCQESVCLIDEQHESLGGERRPVEHLVYPRHSLVKEEGGCAGGSRYAAPQWPACGRHYERAGGRWRERTLVARLWAKRRHVAAGHHREVEATCHRDTFRLLAEGARPGGVQGVVQGRKENRAWSARGRRGARCCKDAAAGGRAGGHGGRVGRGDYQ